MHACHPFLACLDVVWVFKIITFFEQKNPLFAFLNILSLCAQQRSSLFLLNCEQSDSQTCGGGRGNVDLSKGNNSSMQGAASWSSNLLRGGWCDSCTESPLTSVEALWGQWNLPVKILSLHFRLPESRLLVDYHSIPSHLLGKSIVDFPLHYQGCGNFHELYPYV